MRENKSEQLFSERRKLLCTQRAKHKLTKSGTAVKEIKIKDG